MARRKKNNGDPALAFVLLLTLLSGLMTALWSKELVAAAITAGAVFAVGIGIVIAVRMIRYIRWKQSDIYSIDRMDGIEFEHFLKELFTSLGYRVEVTPASGDFGADLIVTGKERKIAVQAKRYGQPVGIDAVQQVFFAQTFYSTTEAWVMTNSSYTPAAIKGAAASGVQLMDRQYLIQLLEQKKTIEQKRKQRAV